MKRRERAAGQEERWVASLKKALLRAGVTVDAIASVVQRAMEAERRAVGEDGEVVSLGDHHAVQLKGASMAIELYRPQSARQLDAERPILNVQAGAKVQLIFFGEAINPTPQEETIVPSLPTQGPVPMSDALKNHRIRRGELNPDGSVPEAPKSLEVPPGPEGKAKGRGEGWLR